MLELINVKKTYTTKTGVNVDALKGISLKFPDTGMVFILGKSGSGKSTLLNLMGGLDSFDSGEMIVKGKSTTAFKQSELDSYRNTSIGFIFQDYNILEEFSVGANIALAMQLQGLNATNDAISNILDQVGLAGFGKRKPNELSGGQQQRVAIARALVKNPEIIMADEPTGALDSNTGLQVFDALKDLSKDKLILIVSHDREYAELYGDRVIELSDGNVISDIEKMKGESLAVSDGVTVLDDSFIKIKKGYELDPDEIKLLVDYFAKADSDSYISSDEVLNSKFRRIAYINDDFTRDKFKKTDESKISDDEVSENFKLVKSRLPQHVAFKMALNSLGYKKFRLAVIIFMTLIALVLFCLADALGSFSETQSIKPTLKGENISYISFTKSLLNQYTELGSTTKIYTEVPLYEKEVDELKSLTGMNFLPAYDLNYISFDMYYDQIPSDFYQYTNGHREYIFSNSLVNAMPITQALVNELGYSVQGRLPINDNEIVITKLLYEHYEIAGYTNGTISIPAEIMNTNYFLNSNPIIKVSYFTEGNQVSIDLKITGIIDTLLPDNLDVSNQILSLIALGNKKSSIYYDGYHSVTFFHPQTLEKIMDEADRRNESTITIDSTLHSWYNEPFDIREINMPYIAFDGKHNRELKDNEIVIPSSIFAKFDNAAQTLAEIAEGVDTIIYYYGYYPVKIIGYYNDDASSYFTIMAGPNIKTMINSDDWPMVSYAISKVSANDIDKIASLHIDKNNSYRMRSYIAVALNTFENLSNSISIVFTYIGLVLILLAALLLMNFIATSIGNKRKEIGILRAIGSRGRDVFNIFFTESLIIAIFNFILAIILSYIIAAFFNRSAKQSTGMVISLLNIGIRQILIVLATSIGSAFIGSILPIISVARKKPIDIIKKR
ncbi:MAG: ATP-binding cassette domain-containing protein [Christensenellaceae bacterium]|nr:ATP-binding cassette domain-containing protein [Christensenellaceae bacterium]